MLPRASYRSRIGCRPLGLCESSRNRDRDILASSAVLPLSFVISHSDMVPLMISTAASLHAPLVCIGSRTTLYMRPPADTGAWCSVPDAWQALRLAHLIPSCRDHRRRTSKRGRGNVSKGGGLLFEVCSATGPSPGMAKERAWLI